MWFSVVCPPSRTSLAQIGIFFPCPERLLALGGRELHTRQYLSVLDSYTLELVRI